MASRSAPAIQSHTRIRVTCCSSQINTYVMSNAIFVKNRSFLPVLAVKSAQFTLASLLQFVATDTGQPLAGEPPPDYHMFMHYQNFPDRHPEPTRGIT